MEENIKSRIILILAIVSAIFIVISVGSCMNAKGQKTALDKERASSWDLEQKIAKLAQEKKALDARLGNLLKDLEAEKAAHEITNKALIQEQMVNNSLKEELQKITKLKDALEEDLKEALARSAKPK